MKISSPVSSQPAIGTKLRQSVDIVLGGPQLRTSEGIDLIVKDVRRDALEL